MMESFLKSLGVAEDVLEHLDQATLAFQRPALLIIGLILLIPIAVFIYRRQQQNLASVPTGFRIALSATRVIILAVLLFVLSGPYLKLDHQITKRPIFAVLLDKSQSMNLPAGPFQEEGELPAVARAAGLTDEEELTAEVTEAAQKLSRGDLAQRMLRHSYDALITPIAEDYDVRVYAFDRGVQTLATDSLAAEERTTEAGAGSHIGSAILHVLDAAAGQPVNAMVLFSDGQNTGGPSTYQAARAASDAGTRLYVAPLGSPERLKDISLVDVYTSGQVAVGDTVRVNVTVESQGFDGQDVQVELRDGDEVLDTQVVQVRDAEHQSVELTFEADVPGSRYLTVSVPPQEGESEQLLANNQDTAFVRISAEKLKLLYLDGLPRWDFRFVKNAVRRDKGLGGRQGEIADVVLESEWKRLPEGERGAALPATAEELSEYHSLILGDVSAEFVTPELAAAIAEAVREHGVGLVVAAGPHHTPAQLPSELRTLLPVEISAEAPGMEAEVYNPYQLEITAAGLIHETLRLYDDPGRNQVVWAQLPPYYWCAGAVRPQPGATVLVWNPSVTNRFGKTPLIAHHYAGDGKVLFVGTDSTWLWRQNVGDRYFYRFWGQAIRFVARRDDDRGQKSWIEVRPLRAQPGEQATVELMAYDENGEPVEAAEQTLTVLGPGSQDAVVLQPDPDRVGRYTGKFVAKEAGVHKFIYDESTESEPAEATMQVLLSPEEFRHPNLNRPALDLLVETTGGQIVDPGELEEIPSQLDGETELKRLHREATVWDNWLTLLILTLTYCVDVAMRRLTGLA